MSAIDINEGLIIEKRLTYAQMKALSSPLAGTMLKPTDMDVFYKYDGTDWRATEIQDGEIINRAEDFPGYGSGEIVLADNTLYYGFNRVAPFIVTDKITVGNSVVIYNIGFGTSNAAGLNFSGSANILLSAYYYSGTGTAITCNQSANDKLLRIARSNIIAASLGTTFFNLVTTGAGSFLILDEVAMIGIGRTVPTQGTATGVFDGFLVSIPIINIVGYSTGLFIRNAADSEVSIRFGGYSSNAAGALLNYDDGGYGTVNIEKCVFPLDTNEYAFNFKNTETFAGGVNVSNGVVTAPDRAFLAGSFNNKSTGFRFRDVTNISNSIVSGYANALNQGGVSTTLTQNKIKRVNATYVNVSSERYSISSNGNMEYLGLNDIFSNVNASITGETGGAVTTSYSFYICKGNSTNTITAFANAGGGQVTVTTSAAHGYSNGDRIVIEDTTNYNGEYTISNVATSTFEITAAFVTTQTGSHYKAQLYSEHTNEFKLEPGSTSITTQVETKKNDVTFLAVENTDSGATFDTYNIHIRINGIS